MFKRRKQLSMVDRVLSIVWPARGFGRLISSDSEGMRMPIDPVDRGRAAWGIAVSFTPFIGLHLLVGLFMAYLCRGNLLACLFGTFVGNPWTFPLFFYLDYRLGAFIVLEFGGEALAAP